MDRKATQVHHLTYKHIFREFVFELIAVCDECHSRLHSDKTSDCSPAEIDGAEWEDQHPCDGCRFASENENRPWCFILDTSAADALASGGDCGPERHNFEPLK
ncbi:MULTISPECIES: hypothetical protein [unclassified Bradyrhizobium]|uniref:hypothetical protein n=1 Tax=unclassified Bradyrhizobium TaxID=2631580 RepID=UPI000366EDAE|nr:MULTISPECIES: hypothetical protein [unclassified Bradyrhizobium]MCK1357156.1 hypothetical protein [Bradyrhizobium sp. CW7]MCK1413192.1 hypothetical protein [Bradyrhizobium sp. CW4]MCK1425792.1 hypothetical protein [Bradyrhizobium sp. 87]MCK1577018.1 hypothetical protein [Bradyrhizobium sp. 174]MCK1710566.1 hypothetical protein [Bradyrhizobium sp. 143]